jgi:methyl-accepting chemotaxis protein
VNIRSLNNQTRLICAAIAVCFLAFAGVGMLRTNAINAESRAISTLWSPRTQLAGELGEAARDYRISESVRILSVNAEMAEQAEADLADNLAAFDDVLAQYRKRLARGESAADVQKVDALWRGYVAANKEMLALSRAGDAAGAADRFRNSASRFYLLSDALNDLSEKAMAEQAKAARRAEGVYVTSLWLMGAGVVAVAILLVAAAVFLEGTVWRQLVRLSQVMQRLAEGDLAAEVAGVERRDEVGDMARAVEVFKVNALAVRRLEEETAAQRAEAEDARRDVDAARSRAEAERSLVVASLAEGLEALSRGDLTVRLTTPFAPEFQKLRADFNAAMEKLQATMHVIAVRAAEIDRGAQDISAASDKLASQTERQAASLEETGAAIEQITERVGETARSVRQASSAVTAAEGQAAASEAVVAQAVAAMREIEASSQRISEILGLMDEIAFQTNLLALNAGVEAARAGDAGRGFAVVATEVRALAQRSTEAAREIKALIGDATRNVAAGVGSVAETGRALQAIAGQVREISGAIGHIAVAAEDQANGLTQINGTMTALDRFTQQNAAMAQEAMAASHDLAVELGSLSVQIAQFRAEGPETATAAAA